MFKSITLLNTQLTSLKIIVNSHEEITVYELYICCKISYLVFLSVFYFKKTINSLVESLHYFGVHQYCFLLKVYDFIIKPNLYHTINMPCTKACKFNPAQDFLTLTKSHKSFNLTKYLYNYLFIHTTKLPIFKKSYYYNHFYYPLPNSKRLKPLDTFGIFQNTL